MKIAKLHPSVITSTRICNYLNIFLFTFHSNSFYFMIPLYYVFVNKINIVYRQHHIFLTLCLTSSMKKLFLKSKLFCYNS
jgi:hypothetical protein